MSFSFEQAHARLEQILEKMNSGSVSLDDSLKLYEEADQLIASCGKRLQEAEKRVETLIKNRNGELALNEQEKPMTQPFAQRS
jgi:exodeoxyribonuclease VII small subunit